MMEGQGSKKRCKVQPRPIEVRKAGSADSWKYFESVERASQALGVPKSQVEAACSLDRLHPEWEFRWAAASPDARAEAAAGAPAEALAEAPAAPEAEGLAARIRALGPAERRAAVAALPEAARRALARHLRAAREPEGGGSRLRALLARLPKLLPAARLEERRALLEGVQSLHARHRALLAAPDVAAVAAMLRGVTPQQRQALLETLPEGTQEALREHLLAERAVARAGEASAEALGACGDAAWAPADRAGPEEVGRSG